MIPYRLIERPAFEVVGRKTWISGQDNSLFGRFWQTCQADGLFEQFKPVSALKPGTQTGGVTLGVSCVEANPARREFYYLIAVELPEGASGDVTGMETYRVPASLWAVFECRGKMPDALVASEIYAFADWLPASGYIHAHAPEMEVYPPSAGDDSGEIYCEFWLPVMPGVSAAE